MKKDTYVFKLADGSEILADAYRPDNSATRPVIFWLHGGALVMGNRETITPGQLGWYLEKGYVVVAIDYRLAPQVKLPEIVSDVRDAYDWIRSEGPTMFHADPARIGVVGHSAGGYLALMCGFTLAPRPRAVVSFYGYGDIAGAWYSRPDTYYMGFPRVERAVAVDGVGRSVTTGAPFSGPVHESRYRFYLYCRQNGLWPKEITGHDPDLEDDWFTPYCPVRNVTRAYPPTFLVHGSDDTDVPCAQSESMAKALRAEGVVNDLMILPQKGHGFDSAGLNDPTVAKVFDRIGKFFKAHLA